MGKDRPVLGAVVQLDPLRWPGKDHAVIAHHGAAAQRCKANIARATRAGMPIAAADRMLVQVDAAAFGGSAAEYRAVARRLQQLAARWAGILLSPEPVP